MDSKRASWPPSTSASWTRSTLQLMRPKRRRCPSRPTRWSGSTRIRRKRARCGSAKESARRSKCTSDRPAGARTMSEITYLEAIREALFEEMERDENVFMIGEDIGAFGGAFKVTEGLLKKYGEARVIDSPISEIGIVG